jgi:CheY-like chemotaxis protein
MDGWQVARRLHKLAGPKRPLIVALSGHGSDEDLRRSNEAGVDLHLTKPTDPRQLKAILDRFQSVIQQ